MNFSFSTFYLLLTVNLHFLNYNYDIYKDIIMAFMPQLNLVLFLFSSFVFCNSFTLL